MSETRSSSGVTGTNPPSQQQDQKQLQHQLQQTETSPLKQNDTKKNWLLKLLWLSASENDQGSLKRIVLYFFIFTVVVTLGLIAQIYYGGYQVEPHGSVATDSETCSEIGVNILKKGGNAVDAAIASSLCLGVVNFHITGLGGGGYMMIYNHMKRKIVDILDFQVSIPSALENKEIDTSVPGLTVGVPGFLMGMWEAHRKYGKLHWEELIRPAVNLAKYGFVISRTVVSAHSHLKTNSKYNRNLIQLLSTAREGKNVTFPELAATLELIAISGPYVLYNGTVASEIVDSVNRANGNMSLDDLSQYQLCHNESLHTQFGDFDILVAGCSSGGSFLLSALNTIQFLDLNQDDDISSIILRLAEVFRDTYMTFLKQRDASPSASEPAACQVSAVDNEELYVSVVSGLNTWLGSQILTKAGFILNNAIANGGVNNEGRPLSFSTPVIALESGEICGKRLVLGSGDATTAAQVLTNAIILKKDLNTSIELPRFYVTKVPRKIKLEDLHDPFYDPVTTSKLSTLLELNRFPLPYKSVNVIEKEGDAVFAHSDSRGGGLAAKF